MNQARGAVAHLYVHVPFCATICPFCSFHVVTRTRGVVDSYLGALDRQAALEAEIHPGPFDTVYLGGGTPSLLRSGEISRLMSSLRRWFEIAPDAEITLEAHPADISAAAVASWFELGVTRLSVGVQSFDDGALATLGRTNTGDRAHRAIELALNAGFPVVGADLITGIPGHDSVADLRSVAASGVDHVSTYTLTVEPGTPFEQAGVTVDSDRDADTHDQVSAILAHAGFGRYEASNHARPGRECRHNLGYWGNTWWLGLGPGATSHLPPSIVDDHVAERIVGRPIGEWMRGVPGDVDVIDAATFERESLLAGLRVRGGIDLDLIEARSGRPLPREVDAAIAAAAERGWLHIDGRRISPTAAGLVLHNQLAALLM